jgi:hypothetical protein
MESITGTAADSVTNVCQSGDVSETVVTTVAQATGADPLEMVPLYNVIDPDALNAIFDPAGTAQPPSVKVSFRMAGCDVVVDADGEVVVTPPADAEPAPPTIGRVDE